MNLRAQANFIHWLTLDNLGAVIEQPTPEQTP